MQDEENWTVDRKIPLALIFAIAVQTIAAFWWAARVDVRVSELERKIELAAPQADRLTRVETRLEAVQSGITEIKSLLRPPPLK